MAKPENLGKMRGGVRKRAADGKYAYTITIPGQPAQRCNDCGKRFWVERRRLETCPHCQGELRDTVERRQQTTGGFPTRAAAVKAHTEALHAMCQGVHVVRSDITLSTWLTDEWLPSLEAGRLRESTREGYASHVNTHIVGTALGALPMQQLSRERLSAFYAELLRDGRADGERSADGRPKPLSPSTVRRIHATIHRSLRDAVRSRLLVVSPASDLELPAGERRVRKLMAWESAQLSRFLATVEGDRLCPLWLTFATTGMRRGEALGLEWGDIDLAAARLTIRHAHVVVGGEVVESRPKTDSGLRTIELDPVTVAALRRHHTQQKEGRMAAGSRWQESGHVFVDEVGAPLAPSFVSRQFEIAVRNARKALDAKQRDELLPRISLPGLRHTHATILLVELRWPATVVSKRLGHRNELITLTMYAEALPRYDGEAAVAFANLVVPQGG
jgi:integrase